MKVHEGSATVVFSHDDGTIIGTYNTDDMTVKARRSGKAHSSSSRPQTYYWDFRIGYASSYAEALAMIKNDLRKNESDAEKRTVDKQTIALIGFLAAKLACYEPESETVKKALEYLDVHTQTIL